MITSQQFDSALKIIMEYKLQMENEISCKKSARTFVNIEKEISIKTFLTLQTYYKERLNEHIDWNTLKQMDLEKLMLLDYSILRNYRGFGKSSENKLKKVIFSFSENIEKPILNIEK